MEKKITAKKRSQLAEEIIDFLIKHDIFDDVSIYVNNKRLSDRKSELSATTKNSNVYYITENVNVKTCIEYNNPDTITMSFEGGFYNIINGYDNYSCKLQQAFHDIINKYDLYYEQGNAWNLALYFN